MNTLNLSTICKRNDVLLRQHFSFPSRLRQMERRLRNYLWESFSFLAIVKLNIVQIHITQLQFNNCYWRN